MESDEEATVLSYTQSSTFSESDCFRFEPQRPIKSEKQSTGSSSSSRSTDDVPVASASSSNEVEEPRVRVGRRQRSDSDVSISEWCRCGKCHTAYLVSEKEYLCCHEVHAAHNLTEGDGGR